MPSAQLDLSEFENPRPGRSDGRSPPLIPSSPAHSSASLADQQLHHDESLPNRSKRLKLPYRADVVLEGRRYKGRRVSRGEAGLEAETFELHDPIHVDNDRSASPESMSDDDCENSDAIQKLDEKRQDADRINAHRAERLKAEEQAVAARLAEAEKEEVARAHAVRKQKDLYDAVVNLRIRMQSLVSMARQFPDSSLRRDCPSWSPDDVLDEALKTAETSLSSLSKQSGKTFFATWLPSEEKGSDKDFERWRDSILDHWGAKVDESSGAVRKGGFKSIDTTVSSQVKASLGSGKHLAKARRVRESLPMLGDDLEMKEGSNEAEYDDGEFYRTLLREIIESGEALGGGLRYSRLSKEGKVKKKRDRSFAKGRRLKYDVHEKLVGFLAPVPLPDPGPVDEIVAALFGQRGRVHAGA